MRIDPMGRRLDWKNLQEISPSLQRAVIQSEDRRFYQHSVVDWRALSYAFLTNWFSAHPRGASTITMQLAALMKSAGPSRRATIGARNGCRFRKRERSNKGGPSRRFSKLISI